MNGGAHHCRLAPGQHSFEETLQPRRAISYPVFDLTGPVIEAQTSHSDSNVLNHWTNQPVIVYFAKRYFVFTN